MPSPPPQHRRGGGPAVLTALAIAASPPPATGQEPSSLPSQSAPAPVAPLATLAIWADDVWLAVTDRDGSYFGRLAEEGTFQRFNPLMDHEYDLDIATGLFTASEDARWAGSDTGLRMAGASISHPHILNDIDLRLPVRIDEPVDLLFNYRRQRSLTAQRDYPRLGLRWRGVGGSAWNGRVALGIHFFKPSADLEVGAGREWRTSGGSRLRADLRVALLDAFNNAIFGGLGVEPELVDAHLDYTTIPMGARLALEWSFPLARVELQAGFTNRSRVAVTFPSSGDPSYSQAEQTALLGGLAEVAVSRGFALTAYGTWARADTERRFTDPSDVDFVLEETSRSLGARAGVAISHTVVGEADVRGLWRPEDRTRGDGSEVRHRDATMFAQVALAGRPAAGWLWRVAVPVTDRDAGETLPELTGTNARLVLESGYRWTSMFYFLAGVRWDLDSFREAPFDGGHVRLQATW